MILGNICTRNCAFCGVEKGIPIPPDPEEPRKIAEAVKGLGLNYIVITSVTRDDLPEGGTEQFIKVIKEIRGIKVLIEVLIPDNLDLDKLIETRPEVINHNIETVPRLYSAIRPQADYQSSLRILKYVKEKDSSIYTKSGFMVGLGETDEEVASALRDLSRAGCDIVTIGQYLAPSKNHAKVERYVAPEEYDKYREWGKGYGIRFVAAGPFVRSSYQAETLWKRHNDF
jgi:lipoic acid synthetase